MQSGVVSSDTIADVLRGISQRRRQGVLEVTAQERVFVVKFVQGRVIEAYPGGKTGVVETVEWLVNGGFALDEPERYSEDNAEDSYSRLFARLERELARDGRITKEFLKRVVTERVLDAMYNLDVGSGAFYTFKVQMVEHDREFSPSISIGQLLLDLVELNSERAVFREKFPPGVFVRLAGVVPTGLDEVQQSIVSCIGDGIEVGELRLRTMLSEFHFVHGMLELLRGSIITAAGESSVRVSSVADEVGAYLSDSVDAAFATNPTRVGRIAVLNGIDCDTLGGVIEDEFDDGLGDVNLSRLSYFQSCSVQLLQNSMIPRLVALGFSLLAVISPLLAWRKIIAAFAEM